MTRYLLITVAGVAHAVEIAAIREVVRVASITPVPGPGPLQRGLTAIRGRLVPVIDPVPAGRRLGGPSLLVVVLTGGRAVGVCVDGVGALIEDGTAASLPPRFDVDRLVEAA